ncbi:GMC family oxidoreductase N-terminal domain-containing protein [Streptomyces sp. NBC_01571]|uniref:GMC family oxidoreductase n=1 Tax=Streptomyces sp. NBC_01571 TaxID=2975883 RepID=UPI002252E6DE|nr:GMC family oxidoreductase N-terminal domain-containing protein [Streptomyces sp. NBC_01571]MCX4572118.1 GMC family oxidoreductase N-terminal domain-containing protein [Streptomyces sp. NBC_01571]
MGLRGHSGCDRLSHSGASGQGARRQFHSQRGGGAACTRRGLATWTARGIGNWSLEEVLKTYRLLENSDAGSDLLHGRTGPFPIRQQTFEELTPSLRAFVEAAASQGFARIADPNGDRQNGVTAYPFNILSGVRRNTAFVYLSDEVRGRPNLTVVGLAEVDSVEFSGTTATAVRTVDGTIHEGGEIILSAGAYGSAAILMRSGIGVPGDLERHGIKLVADRPVGLRFQDHPFHYSVHALRPDAARMTPAAGAILWTASSRAHADELDLHISVSHLIDGAVSPTGSAVVLATGLVRPESMGSVKLRSASPKAAPLIDYNFLATPRDRSRMVGRQAQPPDSEGGRVCRCHRRRVAARRAHPKRRGPRPGRP